MIFTNFSLTRAPYIVALGLGLMLSSCGKLTQEDIAPARSLESIEAGDRALSAPVITSVTSTYVGQNIAPFFYGSDWFGVRNTGTAITVNGSGFGTSGQIYFEKKEGTNWVATSSYTISNLVWGPTKITFNLSTNLNSLPIPEARIRLVSGGQTATKTCKTVPWVLQLEYIQCTWHVMKRTIEKGLPTWAPSYSPSAFTTISANYVPSANDVLNWGTNVHQAFIESSTNTYDSVNKIWTYTMTISESNISASNNNYGPVSSTCVVKVKVNANGTRSYVTGYDKYKGKMSAGATLVRIQ